LVECRLGAAVVTERGRNAGAEEEGEEQNGEAQSGIVDGCYEEMQGSNRASRLKVYFYVFYLKICFAR